MKNKSSLSNYLTRTICTAVVISTLSSGAAAGEKSPNRMLSLDKAYDRHIIVAHNDTLYEGFPDIVLLKSGKLLCVYRESDAHAAKWTRTILIESDDRGRTWKNKRTLTEKLKMNLPRINQLSDGTVVVNADAGYRNYLFFSKDDGRTWSDPQKTPMNGQCPDKIVELSNGTWLNNVERGGRTHERIRRPPKQDLWNYISTDKGKTWTQTGMMFEDLAWGGCGEGSTVELPDGTLVCHVRNSSGSSYPSAKVFSHDGGRTWSKPWLSPIYAGMPKAALLQDGRLMITCRQMSGNSSLYAWCGDPYQPDAYYPSSRWGEDDCALVVKDPKYGNNSLRILATGNPKNVPPVYLMPPPEYHDSIVTIQARLRVVKNETGLACTINVTDAAEILLYPDRVEVLNQPDKVFRLDAAQYRDYEIIRDATSLVVKVDGTERIRTEQLVRTGGKPQDHPNWGQDRSAFGTTFRSWDHLDMNKWAGSVWRWDNFDRANQVGKGESYWKSYSISIKNKTTRNLAWSWDATTLEFPNQYEMDHIVEVDWDPQADFGGSSWVQFPDGEILVVYYTAEETRHQRPYIKGCFMKPSDFKAPVPDKKNEAGGSAGRFDAQLGTVDTKLYEQSEADIRAWLDARIKESGHFGVYSFGWSHLQIKGDTANVDLNRGALADSAAQFFRAFEMLGDRKYLEAGLRTADFFLQVQQPAGHFPSGATIKRGGTATAGGGRHPPHVARMEDGYQFRPFCLLLYAHKLTGEEKYLQGAKRCGELITQRMQHPVWGWCPDVFDTRKENPYTGDTRHGSYGVEGGGSYSDYATSDGFRVSIIMYHLTGNKEHLRCSANLGKWIFATQLVKGKVRGWADNYDANNKPVPARSFEGLTIDPRNFNRFVGPLLTWFYAMTGEQKYRDLFEQCYEWMRSVEQPDGWAAEYTYDGHAAWTQGYKTYRYDQPETWPKSIRDTWVKDGRPWYGRSKVQLDDSRIVYDLLQEGGHAVLRNWYRVTEKSKQEQNLGARLAATRRCIDEDLLLPLASTTEKGSKAAIRDTYLQRVRARLAGPEAPGLPESDFMGRTGLTRQSWFSPHTGYEPYRPPLGWASWQYVWDVRLSLGKIDAGRTAVAGRGIGSLHYYPRWDVMGDWTTRCLEVEDWMNVPLAELKSD